MTDNATRDANDFEDWALILPIAAAARAAGDLVLSGPRPAPFTTWPEFKAAFDAVDGPAAVVLRHHLEALRPGAVWAAEFGDNPPLDGEAWVVDAVDGALQYLQGLPQWSMSIALLRQGVAVVAVLHSAVLGGTYSAVRHGGAWRNGRPIAPSAKHDLSLALTATSHPPFVATQPTAARAAGRAMTGALLGVGAVRNLGPTSWQVAEVADGRLDAFWEFGLDAGNLLAGALVAAEAGALVTDIDGAPWTPQADSFVAAAPGLHGPLLDVLCQALATID
jgi:myo-inositol-1(or 4)-monophosphatase